MQWSDLDTVDAQQKVVRLTSADDLLASSGAVVLCPAGTAPPRSRDGIWVSIAPMTETVKRVDESDRVVQTVPREQLRVATFPVIVPAALAREATGPDDLLRRAVDTGQARALTDRPSL